MEKHATLFWNEQGAICCETHSPYKGSDTWVHERWQEITPNERIEIASQGHSIRCECCAFKNRKAEGRE